MENMPLPTVTLGGGGCSGAVLEEENAGQVYIQEIFNNFFSKTIQKFHLPVTVPYLQ